MGTFSSSCPWRFLISLGNKGSHFPIWNQNTWGVKRESTQAPSDLPKHLKYIYQCQRKVTPITFGKTGETLARQLEVAAGPQDDHDT